MRRKREKEERAEGERGKRKETRVTRAAKRYGHLRLGRRCRIAREVAISDPCAQASQFYISAGEAD